MQHPLLLLLLMSALLAAAASYPCFLADEGIVKILLMQPQCALQSTIFHDRL
jgi:hypothetical protein